MLLRSIPDARLKELAALHADMESLRADAGLQVGLLKSQMAHLLARLALLKASMGLYLRQAEQLPVYAEMRRRGLPVELTTQLNT